MQRHFLPFKRASFNFFHDRAVSCRIFFICFRGGVLHSNTSLKIEDLSQHYFARRLDHILLTWFLDNKAFKIHQQLSVHLSKDCFKEQSCFAFSEFFSFSVSPHCAMLMKPAQEIISLILMMKKATFHPSNDKNIFLNLGQIKIGKV